MTDPTPLRYARPNQCRFCTSRVCRYRIVAEDGSLDELACRRHGRALEVWVDTQPKIPKLHRMGTQVERRGGDIAALWANFRRESAKIQARRAEL